MAADEPSRAVHDGTAPAGALTSIFTPPASCKENPDLYYATPSCMPLPERWNLYWSAASFYSPGLCPSGMVSVRSPPPYFGPPVEPDETAIVCCPSNFTLATTSSENFCKGYVPTSSYEFVSVTTTITSDSSTEVDTSISKSYFDTSTLITAYPIQVRWRDVDLAALETDPLNPGAKPTGGSGGGGEGAGEEQGGNGGNGGGDGGGLSGGVIAGIVVGALAFIAILGVALFFLFRRRRQRRPAPAQYSQEAYNDKGHSPAPPMSLSDSAVASTGYVPTGDASVDEELRRIEERRARLRELQHLDEEEARLRGRVGVGMPAELSPDPVNRSPVEAESR